MNDTNILRKRIFFVLLLFLCLSFVHLGWGELYFQNTDHQLEVLRIKGEKPGLTVLIFGGIHGDEPGGYFSSEKLEKIKLYNGNLIVVPRVNFPSIMLNRRELHGDMNRKFVNEETPGDPDTEVVRILKNLMKEADIFINQHDAFGFHREKYLNKLYNPSSYGQSLIIDTAHFYSQKLNQDIHLAELGQRILKRVNHQIENKDHHFGFWDHNSVSLSTKFPEMKKSATYFALTNFSIPAFGLETSKNIAGLDLKVKYQLLVIQEILHEFGLEADFPLPNVQEPELYWIECLKNGKDIIRVNSNTNLRLAKGDTLVISKIYANYDNGLSADIDNWGNLNDIGKEFVFAEDKTILVKKNQLIIGKIFLKPFQDFSLREITIAVNGVAQKIPNWGKLEIAGNHYFNIMATEPKLDTMRFDVRGYNKNRSALDDSHVDIQVRDFLSEYSFEGKGHLYFVKIVDGVTVVGGFQIEILKNLEEQAVK